MKPNKSFQIPVNHLFRWSAIKALGLNYVWVKIEAQPWAAQLWRDNKNDCTGKITMSICILWNFHNWRGFFWFGRHRECEKVVLVSVSGVGGHTYPPLSPISPRLTLCLRSFCLVLFVPVPHAHVSRGCVFASCHQENPSAQMCFLACTLSICLEEPPAPRPPTLMKSWTSSIWQLHIQHGACVPRNRLLPLLAAASSRVLSETG